MHPILSRLTTRLGLLAGALALAGCVTTRQTDPPFTATHQLLVTTAVDRSAAQLKLALPAGSKVFLDPYVDMDGTFHFPKYTVAAVRSRLLDLGALLVASREEADVVVELRAGAQSVNDRRILLGLPGFMVPVPLAGNLALPEVPLFKYHRETGLSKLAVVAYHADGRLIADTGPQYGEAIRSHWVVLFVISRSTQDLLPEDRR